MEAILTEVADSADLKVCITYRINVLLIGVEIKTCANFLCRNIS